MMDFRRYAGDGRLNPFCDSLTRSYAKLRKWKRLTGWQML